MTNSTEIDDRLDQACPDIVGDTVEVKNHAGEASPILLLPASQVPLLGPLMLCRFRRGLRRPCPRTLCVVSRPSPGLRGRGPNGTLGAVLEYLLLQRRRLPILLLSLHGGMGPLDLGTGGAPERRIGGVGVVGQRCPPCRRGWDRHHGHRRHNREVKGRRLKDHEASRRRGEG